MWFNGKFCLFFLVILSCNGPVKLVSTTDSVSGVKHQPLPFKVPEQPDRYVSIATGTTTPAEIVAFGRTLTGTPYKFGSFDPAVGFDCSGFITYVFNHFGIAVPRSSVEFTFVGREVALKDARPGDLVLFTGTDSSVRIVGHMGIMVSSPGEEPKFIHSTSGKAMGVTETPLKEYYMTRYVKTIRVFPQNDMTSLPISR
jgi:cell wall-associated NlpC family hydrolase